MHRTRASVCVLSRGTVDRHRQRIGTHLLHVHDHGTVRAAKRPDVLLSWREYIDDVHQQAPQRTHGEAEPVWYGNG